ncbi:MAG: hypothetical protein ACJ0BT_02450 [Pseudohongiellaceae bacterium]
MIRQFKYLFICILAALSISSINAAEQESGPTENSSSSDTEEIVFNPTEEVDEGVSEVEQPQGDDDFIPSAQISEDLSVSFPVDI